MSAPTHPAAPSPVNAGTPVRQRIKALDVLRGFALCGILLVNVQPIANRGRAVVGDSADTASPWLGLFADQRFFPIFSLLFGIGFALQLASATDRARRPRVILLRRLLVLFGIGVAHFLLWQGDILTTYAAVGLLVLLPSSWLPRWATAVLAAVLIAVALVLGGERLLLVAGLFLLGSTLVRYRVLDQISASAREPIIVGGLLTVAAVPMVWVQADAELSQAAFGRVFAVTGLLLAGVYTCVVFTLMHTPLRSVMAALFAPLGRMALTNYLSATVIVLVIAHVVDSRPQTWGTAVVASIAGTVLAVQWVWSTLWLRSFRYGPVEWLWRWATWAKRPGGSVRLSSGSVGWSAARSACWCAPSSVSVVTNLATMNDRKAGTDRGRQRETVAVSVPARAPRQRGRQRETVVVTPAPRSRVRGVLVAGVVTSAWNCLVVAIPILVAVIGVWWIAGRPGTVSAVVRVAGATWLAGHGIPVHIAGMTIGLPVLAITAAILWRLSKAGANTIRAIGGRDVPAVRAATLSVVIGYTLVTVLVAFLVSGSGFDVTMWRAAAHGAALALVGASLGALSESGSGTGLWHRIPVWWRRGLRTGALSMTATVAAGALLAGVAIAVRGSSVAETISVYHGGALGLAILSLLYIPTLAIWATAYLLGPGFAVGDGTHVSVMEVIIGPLPQFPLFAATPAEPLDWWGTALWGVPLAIGSIQGVILALRSLDLALPRLIYATIVSGITAGTIMAILAFAASGPLGTKHLASMGPQVLPTSLTAAGVIAGSVFVGAMATRLLGARKNRD